MLSEFLETLQPDDTLIAQVEGFRFTTDAPPKDNQQFSSLALWPVQAIVEGLGAK